MSEPPTAKLPRPSVSEWKAWLILGTLAFAPPGVGITASTAYMGRKIDDLTDVSRKNTEAIVSLKLAMEGNKVTEQRLRVVEERVGDHEVRLRALEAK